jgi:hypothetical protein
MFYAVIGLLLGLSIGISDTRSRLLRKLGQFVDANGIRLIGRDGNEVPQADLVAELKKR